MTSVNLSDAEYVFEELPDSQADSIRLVKLDHKQCSAPVNLTFEHGDEDAGEIYPSIPITKVERKHRRPASINISFRNNYIAFNQWHDQISHWLENRATHGISSHPVGMNFKGIDYDLRFMDFAGQEE